MSLRLRSILAAAVSTMLAVAVLGSAVDVLVARHLHGSLDKTLRTRAVEVAQLAASAPALVTQPGALDAPVGSTQAMVEVVDGRDRIVSRSLSLGGRVLPRELAKEAIATGHGQYSTISFGGDRLRVYSAPLADVGGGGAVLVAASTSDVVDTIRTLHALTLLSALVAAAIGGAAVAFLIRGALRPLVRLDRAAADIGRSGDARRRLPDPQRHDEVGRLATTLNAMLDGLERARDAERRFLADASHELRTPLTALRGNVAHLARHGATPALVADLEADAERLAQLADDLLALSREEVAPPPSDDVALDELARAAAGAGVTVQAERVTVRGDRAALERALSNLIENAHRHGSGAVTVAVEAHDGLATISVEDEGPGIAVEDRERVFERFYGRGSGLGLAIVRATAERHGGRAYADGSRVTIELVRKASESIGHPSGEELEKGLP
ncbi:MAG TPA: HAMP domain-containing sensor histidine kinase [Gaiellaceae bacterium]|nr:HAMP domain-containing sensor histidine kinase [Gaiellaceae bacterium]